MNGGIKSVFTDLINTITARCRYILNVCLTKKEVLVGKNQGDRAITCREGLVQLLYTNILPFFSWTTRNATYIHISCNQLDEQRHLCLWLTDQQKILAYAIAAVLVIMYTVCK